MEVIKIRSMFFIQIRKALYKKLYLLNYLLLEVIYQQLLSKDKMVKIMLFLEVVSAMKFIILRLMLFALILLEIPFLNYLLLDIIYQQLLSKDKMVKTMLFSVEVGVAMYFQILLMLFMQILMVLFKKYLLHYHNQEILYQQLLSKDKMVKTMLYLAVVVTAHLLIQQMLFIQILKALSKQ